MATRGVLIEIDADDQAQADDAAEWLADSLEQIQYRTGLLFPYEEDFGDPGITISIAS